jgi:hypothetical protein
MVFYDERDHPTIQGLFATLTFEGHDPVKIVSLLTLDFTSERCFASWNRTYLEMPWSLASHTCRRHITSTPAERPFARFQ